jgi:hypothetical protein
MKKLITLLIVAALSGCGGGGRDNAELDCTILGATPVRNNNQMFDLEIANDTLFYVEGNVLFRWGFEGQSVFIGFPNGGLFGLGEHVATFDKFYGNEGEITGVDMLPGTPSGLTLNEAIYSVHNGNLFKLNAALEQQTIDLVDATSQLATGQQVIRAIEVKDGLLMLVSNDAGELATILYNQGANTVLLDTWIDDITFGANQNQLFMSSSAKNKIAVYDYQLGTTTVFADLQVSTLFNLNNQMLYAWGSELYKYNASTQLFDPTSLPSDLGQINDAEHYNGEDYLATQSGIWQVNLTTNSASLIIGVQPGPLNDCSL